MEELNLDIAVCKQSEEAAPELRQSSQAANISDSGQNSLTAEAPELWQVLPVPESPEPHPEHAFDSVKNGKFSLTAASVRGRKHKHEGTNRDDFYAYSLEENFAAVCVCDGAGSKKFSRIGAKLAARSAVSRKLSKLFTPEVLKTLSLDKSSTEFLTEVSGIASKVRSLTALAYKAVEDGVTKRVGDAPDVFPRDISEYESTFLYALIVPLEEETLLLTLTIGDGNIAAFTPEGVKILGVSVSGEYSGETEFLESKDILTENSLRARTRIIREKIDTIVIASDGVADDYFPNETEFPRLLSDIEPLLDNAEALKNWLDSYYIRGSFDDRTLAVIRLKQKQ
ncbi:MAG: protein phosphatase 2C domain-containing protein [Ruminococcus sp.]|nr:protein phosphatase 2C domain-containing protein [Ruminococcus sp.]